MMRYVNSQLIIGLAGLGVAAFLVACGGGGGGNVRPAPESGNQMTPGNQMTITPPGTTSPPALPPAVAPTSPPQAPGRDLPNIEIAGLGTTSQFAVRNSGGTAHVLTAGTWYEPRDGSYQRMIVTRTTSVPSEEVMQVPIACMQQGKRAPANGLRFFSSSKAVTGSVQSCQRNCLSGNAAEFQSCIWGCEASSDSPQPGSARSSSLTWNVVDRCNDGRRVEYRFFESSNGRRTGRAWPGGSQFWATTGYDRTVTNALGCSPGTSVVIGARIQGTNQHFGAGFDGTRSCSECAYTCGANTVPYRFGCPR